MNPWEKYAAPQALADGPWAKYQQKAPEPQTFDPSEGGGTLQFGPWDTGIPTPQGVDRFLSGIGAGMSHIGRGIGQAAGLVDQGEIDDANRLEKPLQDTTAGAVGDFAGRVAALVPTMAIPGANKAAGAALIGAATGALTTEGGISDRALGGVFGGAGGAAGVGLGKALQAAGRGSGNSLTAAQQQALSIGDNLGLRTTPGQATGNKALQRMEAWARSNPVTAGGFDAMAEQNARKLGGIAAKAIGQSGDEISSPVLARAFDDLGQVFDSVSTKAKVPLDQNALTGKLLAIMDDHAGQYVGKTDVADNALFQTFDNFLKNGEATQEQLKVLSSNLGRAVKNNMTSANGDRTMGMALGDLKELVDDALMNSLPAAEQAAFKTAREQYRTLMQLTGRTNVVNPSSGNVNPRALAQLLQQTDRRGFLQGRNASDLYEAARFSQAFPDIVGDSGTATRSMGPSEWLKALPARLLTSAYASAPTNAAARGIGTGVQNSQQALSYLLRNGSVPVSAAGAGPATALYFELGRPETTQVVPAGR